MRCKPFLNLWMFVRPVVVQDDVHRQGWINRAVHAVEETNKLLMPVPRLALANDGPIEHVERGKLGGCSVPLIIVGLSFRKAGPQGQNWLCAIQRLDLAFLINTEHQSLVRRV